MHGFTGHFTGDDDPHPHRFAVVRSHIQDQHGMRPTLAPLSCAEEIGTVAQTVTARDADGFPSRGEECP